MVNTKPLYYNTESENILVLLPPGIGEASHFDTLISDLPNNFGAITFDLPGVNPDWSEGTTEEICRSISDIIKPFSNKRLYLIGESYGGVLVVELQKYLKGSHINLLVGTGEFFMDYQKRIFKKLFKLPQKSKRTRSTLAKALSSVRAFNLKGYDDERLKIILNRWLDIIDYQLPLTATYPNKTYLVKGNRDIIIKPNSIYKIMRIFPDLTLIKSNNSHFDYINTVKKLFIR
jgi:pimeloyl-ACP methyl ester carboxylesterase